MQILVRAICNLDVNVSYSMSIVMPHTLRIVMMPKSGMLLVLQGTAIFGCVTINKVSSLSSTSLVPEADSSCENITHAHPFIHPLLLINSVQCCCVELTSYENRIKHIWRPFCPNVVNSREHCICFLQPTGLLLGLEPELENLVALVGRTIQTEWESSGSDQDATLK